MNRTLLLACLLLSAPAGAGEKVPILYSTDLYHPHGDPDDHYDLMTLLGLPEFDIRGVVLDADPEGNRKPAVCAMEQVKALTRRDFPYASGLIRQLDSPEDKAEDRPAGEQKAVDLILRMLSESDEPVTVFTTGSLRDMAAAYNREPKLFAEKVARFYINIGWVGEKREWNVGLDAHAYVRILKSDLPVYWCPCFGEDNWKTYWKFRQGDVLAEQRPPIQNFFLYMLGKLDTGKVPPVDYLWGVVDTDAAGEFYPKDRNMWCTGPFLHAAGRDCAVFEFAPLTFTVDERAATIPATGEAAITRMTFRITAPERYDAVMTETLRELYAGMALATP